MKLLTNRILVTFSKWSKPKPNPVKIKQSKKSFALGDQKAAKLSKSQQQLENKQKALEQQKLEEETTRKIGIMRSHSASLEEYKSPQQLEKIRVSQHYFLKGRTVKTRKIVLPPPLKIQNAKYRLDELESVDPQTNERKLKKIVPGNYTNILNEKYLENLREFQADLDTRRIGTLGIKLGMTMMWDSWGQIVPVTALELDRVQVVQIKKPTDGNTFYQVQVGLGQLNMKKITKPLLGHFIKHRIPPKRILCEFPVSEECLLPIGYTMSARHFTPGMFIDISGKTVGHGFQGTIKKFGFRRQPESHGNSTTTRVLGSTGCRQDPGRVFKNKKMYGRMGGNISKQVGMQVFRIDVDKNIIYVKGSVPGKNGSVVKIRDTLAKSKIEKNLQIVHYPTFIEQKGVQYARQFSMYCGERDPAQIEIHDNAFIIDDENEDTGVGVGETTKVDPDE